MFIYMLSNTPRKVFLHLKLSLADIYTFVCFFYIYFDSSSRETENNWIGEKGLVLMMC